MLGAKLEPCWPPFSAQDRPRGLQDPSKTPPGRLQDGPRCLQRRFGSPKTVQEASKPAPEPSRPRFWTIFDRFLIDFWLIFGSFLIHFSSIFHYISRLKKQAFQHQKPKNSARWRVRSSAARWISAPGPKAPSCVSGSRGSGSLQRSSVVSL